MWLALVAAGCGSDESTSGGDAGPAPTAGTTETSSKNVGESAIVGRWERVHKCSELLNALDEAGLRKYAPALIAEEYFPDMSAAELAQQNDLCEGAKAPFVHSHFFDASGRFGSLDENENQVDDGFYEIVDRRTFRFRGPRVEFRYQINGDTLTLSPVITPEMERETAARAIAVAYPGHVWKRVSCKTWC